MKYAKFFSKTLKKAPKDAGAISHQLLVRAGFIDQVMAGVFSILPLGLRVLNKIDGIIRKEMDRIGGQEISMPALQPKADWVKTGRWETVDILFKIKSQRGHEYALGPTHEEIVTPLVKKFINSYRDLPVFVYQIQNKFRDELRAKSGLIRGREFGMKDLYSFHATHLDLEKFYQKVIKAYLTIFQRCGLEAKVTTASGGAFTDKPSHEFMVISPAGEDTIIYCPSCPFCENKEISLHNVRDKCSNCKGDTLVQAKAVEVGNIFDLGTKFAYDFDLHYSDGTGKKRPVVMGCYGIGDTRLMATIVEIHHDKQGIVWPAAVAPFTAELVEIGKIGGIREIREIGEKVYRQLQKSGLDVLYDDRKDVSVGEKFADADLIGCPVRLVVSEKSGDKVEWKNRPEKRAELVAVKTVIERLRKK